MPYVDGFLLAVPKSKVQVYRRIAQRAGKIWRKAGAREYLECVGDDLNTNLGVRFPRVIKAKSRETVIFSWIVFKSKGDRDRVNKKVMKDPWMQKMMNDTKAMPFDHKRMAYGGFKVIVDV